MSVYEQPIVRALTPSEVEEDLANISKDITTIAQDAFGQAMSEDLIRRRLLKEPNILIASIGKQLVGFQFQGVHPNNEGCYVYYPRAIAKSVQGRGIARLLLDKAIELYEPTVIGARTQNPAELLSFIRGIEKYNPKVMFPFGAAQEPELVKSSMREFLAQIGISGSLDTNTGLNKNAYQEGRLGDYVLTTDHITIQSIENYMQHIGLERENGDALFYFAVL